MALGQPCRHRTPERPAKNNYLIWIHLTFLNEVPPRRLGIFICAGLAGLSLTLAKTPVVEDENIQPKPVKYLDGLQAVRYVAGVTVTE